jgi:hypothetical protein
MIHISLAKPRKVLVLNVNEERKSSNHFLNMNHRFKFFENRDPAYHSPARGLLIANDRFIESLSSVNLN